MLLSMPIGDSKSGKKGVDVLVGLLGEAESGDAGEEDRAGTGLNVLSVGGQTETGHDNNDEQEEVCRRLNGMPKLGRRKVGNWGLLVMVEEGDILAVSESSSMSYRFCCLFAASVGRNCEVKGGRGRRATVRTYKEKGY